MTALGGDLGMSSGFLFLVFFLRLIALVYDLLRKAETTLANVSNCPVSLSPEETWQRTGSCGLVWAFCWRLDE